MEPIKEGMQGAAVEDVQTRLVGLGFSIDAAERDAKLFGSTTAQAVRDFRAGHDLHADNEIDLPAWGALVDASYKLGDRTDRKSVV